MNQSLFLAILIVGGFAVVLWFLNKKLSEKDTNPWLKSMQQSVDSLGNSLNQAFRDTNQNLTSNLLRSNEDVNKRLEKANQSLAEVAREVGQMSEIGRSMKDLQEFLKSPKMRGNIGEEILKDLITQIMPKNSFHLQYSFKSGEKVDAALKTSAGLLPVDSKFPLENFQKMIQAKSEADKKQFKKIFISDVKKHLQSISKKYILPEENTMDFALMYIPSESVYYEVANLPELMDFARNHRVYPVSPSIFYAHLRTILLSFEGNNIAIRSRQIFRLLRAVQKDYEKTQGVLSVLSRHLNNAYSQMANVSQSFSLLGQKLASTRSLEDPSPKNSLPSLKDKAA